MRAERFEHIGPGLGSLGGKIAATACADIEDVGLGNGEGSQPRERRSFQSFLPFRFAEVEALGRQWLVRWRSPLLQRIAARVIVVGDLGKPFMRSILGQMLERQRCIRQVVEDRLELVVEKRKPMLHPRIATSLAHRFVQQIVRGGGPELCDIAGPKSTNGFGHKLEFRDRHQIEPTQLIFADLRLRIERADRFQRVAEEIEPHRHIHAGRIKIENPAAHSILAGLAHGGSADKTVELQPIDNPFHADDVAGCD